MTKLSAHQSSEFAKVVYIGDSGTGKTGSLTSLVADGYKLRILDMDNGLDALRQHVMHECPDKIDNIDFETRRDKYKGSPGGPIIAGQPKAFVEAIKLLDTWSDNTIPAEWGPDTVFVLDSLTSLGKASFEWAKGMNPTAKDARQWYFSAQQAIESVISLLTSSNFCCNVVVISHVNYRELQDGSTKGYPSAVGSALGPTLCKYFNTLILAETSGTGKNVRRRIKTVPTAVIDLKNPAPFRLADELPLESGLSEIFKTVKGNNEDV